MDGYCMEFIEIKNKDNVVIINDTYDNLVYFRMPPQRPAQLYTGALKSVSPMLAIPTGQGGNLRPWTPYLVPMNLFRYGRTKANVIRVFYFVPDNYTTGAPLIAVSVPRNYEFTAQWHYDGRSQYMVMAVDVTKHGEVVTQSMIDEIANTIRFYRFGELTGPNGLMEDAPRIAYIDTEKGKTTALQVLGRHKYFNPKWGIPNDIIYDSRLPYLRILDSYTKDWAVALSNYKPGTYADMTRSAKLYDCKKVAVIPLATVDVAVWGPYIVRGNNQIHTGEVWQTIKCINDNSVELKAYEQINWNVNAPNSSGSSGNTFAQYLVVDVSGYDR